LDKSPFSPFQEKRAETLALRQRQAAIKAGETITHPISLNRQFCRKDENGTQRNKSLLIIYRLQK